MRRVGRTVRGWVRVERGSPNLCFTPRSLYVRRVLKAFKEMGKLLRRILVKVAAQPRLKRNGGRMERKGGGKEAMGACGSWRNWRVAMVSCWRHT